VKYIDKVVLENKIAHWHLMMSAILAGEYMQVIEKKLIICNY
jgi:hypothetical protein